jgi:hypothetical protein
VFSVVSTKPREVKPARLRNKLPRTSLVGVLGWDCLNLLPNAFSKLGEIIRYKAWRKFWCEEAVGDQPSESLGLGFGGHNAVTFQSSLATRARVGARFKLLKYNGFCGVPLPHIKASMH